MVSESYSTHMGVTGPKNFKKSRRFFSENPAPGILRPLVDIQALLVTLHTLPWLVHDLLRPYTRFDGATATIGVSLVRLILKLHFFWNIVLPGFCGP